MQATLVAMLQRFAALGLEVELTELDIRVRTPGATAAELTAQAQGYANVVSARLAVAACDAIIVWGVNVADPCHARCIDDGATDADRRRRADRA
jgi:GH35 family endo-1,4-beta-xylanase